MKKSVRRTVEGGVAAAAVAALVATGTGVGTAAPKHISFALNQSTVADRAKCLQLAQANVTVTKQLGVDSMTIRAKNLPANTDFDVFITEIPNSPFGVSWYQGDLETDGQGKAVGTYVGKFDIETFAVSPGIVSAPQTHPGDDAILAPAFKPVHTYHVGFWFDSPQSAKRAGCPGTTTPFNGDHTAGVQAMTTNQFGNRTGPLRSLQ